MTELPNQPSPNQDDSNHRPPVNENNGAEEHLHTTNDVGNTVTSFDGKAVQGETAGGTNLVDEEQFFIRLGQVDLFYKEYAQTKWNVGQTFGTHLQAFNNAYLAASSAGRLQLFQKAYGYLLKAEAEWKWLQDNGLLRQKAAEIRESVQSPKKQAEECQAKEYAKSIWQEACQKQEEGVKLFEAGEFETAIQRFSEAVSLFDKAGREALAEHIRQQEAAFAEAMAQKNFRACETAIQGMAALSPEWVDGMRKSMMVAKTATISEFKESIRNNLNQRRFAEAEQTVQKLMDIDREEGLKCETNLKQAKDDYCNELERSILDALKHSRFADAEKQVGMMGVVDSARADELDKIVQRKKTEFLRELGDSIEMNLRKNEFNIAHYKVRDMAVVSEEEGRRWEGIIQICELEHAISEAIAADRFAEGEKIALELSALDAEKGRQKQEAVEDAKRKRIEQLIEAIKADMEHGHFESAYETVRNLSAIDEAEGRRWDGNVHVGELEQAISEAIARHQYDEAAKTAAELSALDEAKGREWAEKSRNAKQTQVEQLIEAIKADMEQGHFESSYETVRELSAIDEAEGRRWEGIVHVGELEHAISEAIAGKHFAEGEKNALELSALDAEKGRQKQEAVAAAKRKQIELLMEAIKADMEQGNFKSAYETVRELSALDESEGKRWEKIVHVCEFEHAISAAIARYGYDEAGKIVAELSALDEAKGREWAEKTQTEKQKHVEQLMEAIKSDMENARFSSAYETVRELSTFDESEGRRWESLVHVCELEQAISAAIAQHHYDEAGKVVAELSAVDEAKGREWAEKSQNAKAEYIRQLETSISEAIENGRFDSARGTLGELAVMDADDATVWEKKLRVHELSKNVLDAVAKMDFDAAESFVSELAVVDTDEAGQLSSNVQAAKNARIDELGRLVGEAIERNCFDDCGSPIEKIALLDKGKAQEWKETVAKAKTEAIARLEASVSEAVKQKNFAVAHAVASDLVALDRERGQRQEKIIHAHELAEEIAEAIEKKKFIHAEKLAGDMVSLDAEMARGCEERIKVARAHELAASIHEAIEKKRFAHAEKLVGDMVPLNVEMARGCTERINAAKKECVKELSKAVSVAESSGHMVEVDGLLEELSGLDAEAARRTKEGILSRLQQRIESALSEKRFDDAGKATTEMEVLDSLESAACRTRIEEEKESYCEQLEKNIKISLEEARFEDAEDFIQQLTLLDELKGGEWKDAARLRELECSFDESLANGSFDEANGKIQEMSVLDATKAAEMEQRLETVREEQASLLERQIAEMIRYGALPEAENKLRMLESLDGEKAQRLGTLLDKVKKGKKTERWLMAGVVVFVLIAIVFCIVAYLRHSSELRKEVAMSVTAMEKVKDSALQEQADLYAVDALQKAMALKEQAQKEFESGHFALAKAGYDNAKGAFDAAGKAARKEHVLRLASDIENAIRQGQFDKAQIDIKKLGQLDADKAAELQAKLNAAKEGKQVLPPSREKSAIIARIQSSDNDRIKTIDLGNGVKLKLVKIEAGSFNKIYPFNVQNETIILADDFWLGEMEVTQGQYAAIMDGVVNDKGEECKPRPSNNSKGGDRLPVECVSWDDACAFCRDLNDLLVGQLPDNYHFDLPTEAQWEYACRAGTTTLWHYGDSLDPSQANFTVNDTGENTKIRMLLRNTVPVGSYKPNAWGLYDMHGNVWEWCRDAYDIAKIHDKERLKEMEGGSPRIVRGGGWDCGAALCCSSFSDYHVSTKRRANIGFRIALTPVNPTSSVSETTNTVNDSRDMSQAEEVSSVSYSMQSSGGGWIMTIGMRRGVQMKMVKIEAGSFKMGDSENVHTVTLTKDYWLGETEVTQGQYAAIMDGVTNEKGEECDPQPSLFKGDERLPVECVSWYDAQAFCKRLNEKFAGKLPAGYRFELPTEEQWEYAARGGNKSKGYAYSGSNRLDEVGWYYENSGRNRLDDKEWDIQKIMPNSSKPHQVGNIGENELGLYDMSGNVSEWCRDLYDASYPSHSVTDPIRALDGDQRVLRGGSWLNVAMVCRLSFRDSDLASKRIGYIGFRVALVPTP